MPRLQSRSRGICLLNDEVNLFHHALGRWVVFHFDEYEASVSQALVALVVVVTQVGENPAKFLLGQDGLERVVLATAVIQLLASCRHQRSAKPFALVKHGLIGMAQQLLEFFGLPVYGYALPPDDLVGLPGGAGRMLGVAALLGARLALLVAVLLLQ